MKATVALCGTRSGYHRHLRQGEATCEACRAAQTTYVRRRLATSSSARLARRVTNASYPAATAALRAAHPKEWTHLLAEARAAAYEAERKAAS